MSLLLAVDVGNTNIVMGIYDLSQGGGAALDASWRMATSRERTADEYGLVSLGLLGQRGISAADIEHVVISSVVPPLHPVLASWLRNYFQVEPFWVEPGIRTGLKILLDNPLELGADRIVNAVAGMELYGAPLIAVDFGTATTFDIVNDRKEYVGGIICPGLNLSAEALFQRASRLPRVEIAEPERLVGKSTVQAMQSGLYYGYVGLVDGILERLLNDYPGAKVVATGGLAKVIAPASRHIQEIAGDLTLDGLRILWQKNREAGAMPLALIHLARVDSTQDFLERNPALGFCAVLADCQLKGRGRRGNDWESAAGAGLWLSAALPLGTVPPGLVLQRAMGAVAEVLEPAGAPLGLKWPNDLVAWRDGRLVKLGGIIGQVKGERMLLGVGVNLHSAPVLPDRAIAPACLAELCPGTAIPDCPTLALEILAAWEDLAIQREPAFRWPETGTAIRWETGAGVCAGWLEDGRLAVRTVTGVEHLAVGDISGLT